MAEREKEALVGNAPLRPDTILAMPWPIRSWFSFHWVPPCWFSTLALEAISRKLIKVITSAGSSNWLKVCQGSQPGQKKEGRPWGRKPTTAPPLASTPSHWPSAALPATNTKVVGNFGAQRLASTRMARLARPITALVWWTSLQRCGHARGGGMPSRAGSCDIRIRSAAAWVKPVITGELTRLSSQPNRPIPSTSWNTPDSSASHTASSTQRWLPGSAICVSAAPMNRLVSAVGPTPRRVDELHSTATSAGSSDA